MSGSSRKHFDTWQLTAVGERTRPVTRTRARYHWERLAETRISVLLMELGDFPMIRKMLRGIKQRAERHAASSARRHDVLL